MGHSIQIERRVPSPHTTGKAMLTCLLGIVRQTSKQNTSEYKTNTNSSVRDDDSANKIPTCTDIQLGSAVSGQYHSPYNALLEPYLSPHRPPPSLALADL